MTGRSVPAGQAISWRRHQREAITRRARRGDVPLDLVRHYPVPTAFSTDPGAARIYARHWARWTGGEQIAIAADSTQGAALLATWGIVQSPRDAEDAS